MDQEWKVLLIGGSSAAGKSYLARQLANYYKIPLTEIDDIRIALQQVVDKEKHADLYFFIENPTFLIDYPTEELVKKLLRVGEELWPALDALITKHIVCKEPVIFEGDSIVPRLLSQRDLAEIKAVFIHEGEENLREREIKRARGGQQQDPQTVDKYINFSVAYGEELKKQAKENNFLVINASPLETLFNRVKKALEN